MEEQEELWRPVVGYEELYEVSNWGRVRSQSRRGTKGGILKPTPAKNGGYLQIGLFKKGKQETCQVHQLVMQAFVGRCPDGYETDHYDWKPENNKLENLSYQPKEVNRARHSPEWLNNTAEAAKKRAQDPEWRKNNAEALKKLHQDQEWRKKVREGVKKRSQNQEWQKNHAEAVRKARSKPVDQFTLDGVFIKRWTSASEAERKLGFNNRTISACCNGRQKTAGGFIWKFAEPC